MRGRGSWGGASVAARGGAEGRAKPPSRKELSAGAHVTHIQTVGLRAGRPAHLGVTAIVGDPPDLLAAWRLGARQTTPRPPPPSRRADRRLDTPDRSRQAAKAQRAQLRRSRHPHPDRWHRRGTPSTPSASRRSSATPPTSLRLCASAREKQRRDDHRPLEEPIAVSTPRTGRAKPPSRKELTEDPHVAHIQTVGIGAGRRGASGARGG
jgi:hypothetical protein